MILVPSNVIDFEIVYAFNNYSLQFCILDIQRPEGIDNESLSAANR